MVFVGKPWDFSLHALLACLYLEAGPQRIACPGPPSGRKQKKNPFFVTLGFENHKMKRARKNDTFFWGYQWEYKKIYTR